MRRCVLLLAPLLFASTSCQLLQDLTSNLAKPGASIAGVRFQDLDLESLSLLFDVDVSNPYQVALPVLGLSYDIKSGDRGILAGALGAQDSVPAKGSSRLVLPARIQFRDLLAVLTDVRPGALIPYQADLGLTLDVPGGEALSIPLGTSGELPVPAVPDVEVLGLRWTTLTLNRAEAVLDLSVLNNNEFGLDLKQIQYALSLGGHRVAEAGVSSSTSFDAGGSSALSVPLSFSPLDLGTGVFNLLKGSQSTYSLDGALDVDTAYGPLTMPYARKGTTSLFR